MVKPELQTAAEWIAKGQLELQQLNYAEALTCFHQALTSNPNAPEHWLQYGTALEKLGCYSEAITANSNAQKLYANPQLRVLPPLVSQNAIINEAIARQSTTPDYWVTQGHLQYDLKCYREAVKNYDKALALAPTLHVAWFSRANALTVLQEYELAITSYDQAVALKSDDYQAWNNRGYVLHKLERYEDAIASYRKALESNPNAAPSWNNIGYALYHLQSYQDAITHYAKAIELNPNYPEAWHNRGNALRALGHYETAIASYDQAIALRPDFTEAQNNRTIALAALEQKTKTSSGYDTVPDLNLNCLDAWFSQANSLLYLGRYDEAIANFNKVLTHPSKSPDTQNSIAKRVYDLAALYAYATEVFKNSALAWSWFKRPSYDLNGQTPLQLLQTEKGAQQIEAALWRLEQAPPSPTL